MPPKPSQSKSLGPLAGRTLKSGAGSASSSSSSNTPHSNTPHTPPRNYSHGTPPPGAAAGATRSPSSVASPTPYLLAREQETSHHRSLRRLLRDVTRHREEWEFEVIEMGDAVGLYCTALGEIEDEMRELGWSKAKGKGKQKQRQSSGSRSESESDSDEDEEDKEGDAKQRSPHNTSTSTLTLLSALHDLDERYHSIETGRRRVLKEETALVKLKDELRQLRNEWSTSASGRAGERVQWGQRTGEEFEEAAAMLILQVQLQTAQFLSTLDELYITCSPLGSLHQAAKGDANATSTAPSLETYDVNKASQKRKEILLVWRDWPFIERGHGVQGFAWWKRVWRTEVGRWDE